jgi:predicted AlkP superfamily phosphohydrolase/phosphomutase
MKKILVASLALGFAALGVVYATKRPAPAKFKLYWFIPDGVRAEPDLFRVFEWAKSGELPNLKRLMEEGSYGYSLPVFPSHTPVNFAALLTGTLPKHNGVADGPMHVENHPLSTVSIGGFSSGARRIPAVWTYFEKLGYKVGIISTPGSTPPDVEKAMVVRGRWGNWGIDLPALTFEYKGNNEQRRRQNTASRFFYFGSYLTHYLDYAKKDFRFSSPESDAPPKYLEFDAYGKNLWAALVDSKKDGRQAYDSLSFSLDGNTSFVSLREQEWSEWTPVNIEQHGQKLSVKVRFHAIKIGPNGFFRFRILFDNLNETVTQPSTLAGELRARLGPMVDFVDNFPPQLVHYPEDRLTFLREQAMSFDWHRRFIPEFLDRYQPDVVIHDVYNPNQMLTSRWWLGSIDPEGSHYHETPEPERDLRWKEVKAMYHELDAMVGEILKRRDANSFIVFSSDHGVQALKYSVHLNNLLARHGYLKFKIDPKSGEPIIDWAKSRAIFLKMDGVFLHPDGLAGNWKRGKGPAYERLRKEISKLLRELKDEHGIHPLSKMAYWEDVPDSLGLPSDRVGDIVIANRPGYGWSEEMSADHRLFSRPIVTGHKQAILASDTKSLWTPFFIVGPGIKKNHAIAKPFSQVSQLPTILKAMGIKIDQPMDGKPLEEIFVQ